MNAKKLIILCICAVLIIGGIIAAVAGNRPGPDPTESSGEALLRYQEAMPKTDTPDLVIKIKHEKETSVNGEGFLETATQTLRYKDRGSASFVGIMQEQRTIGDYSISIEEAYANGTGYFTVQGSKFSGVLSAEDYLNRYVPAVLIDPSLYENITANKDGALTTITFSDAKAPESWMKEHNSGFLRAEGSVQLTPNDLLHESNYVVSYSTNGTYIRHSITVTIDLEDSLGMYPPFDEDSYTSITYLDGPRMLEIACGYILSSSNITSTFNSHISCDAFGDTREEQIFLNMTEGTAWSARLDTDVTLTNTGREGDVSQLSKTELFTNGNYTVFTNGIEDSDITPVDQETFQTWCNDILVGTIMLPQYLSDVALLETAEVLHISYTANEDFVQHIGQNACQTLYREPELLTQLAQAHTTDHLEAYMDFDLSTGLPISAGIRYKGTYIINDVPYLLVFEADQSYNVLSRTAYNAIYEKAGVH